MNSVITEFSPNETLKAPIIPQKPYSEELRWYIFYTYPKAEKLVYKDLVKRKYEAFLPVKKAIHIWRNQQKKLIESPLFPNYIFVRTYRYELNTILRLPKVVMYITFNKKPSVIPAQEIETIKNALAIAPQLSVRGQFCEGEKVIIREGPLAGNSGVLIKQMGKTRFGIWLSEIKHTIMIDICESALEKIG